MNFRKEAMALPRGRILLNERGRLLGGVCGIVLWAREGSRKIFALQASEKSGNQKFFGLQVADGVAEFGGELEVEAFGGLAHVYFQARDVGIEFFL